MKPEMKSGKLIASVLLILIGFCAGVGMNLLPVNTPLNTIVRGAPGDPNPALKRVAHDATLAGDGTATAPLGIANGGVGTPQLANGAVTTRKIANGAVSAPKLSPLAPPSEGQLLGFNGVNLEWQNAPIGGVRVVDSVGHLVGPFDRSTLGDAVLLNNGQNTFVTAISRTGFRNIGAEFFHTTTDCSGPRYMLGSPETIARFAIYSAGRLYFPLAPFELITYQSVEEFPDWADASQPGPCKLRNPHSGQVAGFVGTLDVSTLGLVPPFHLEF
ncbi:MAG: hypothetical protein HY316_01875 [Acidobacteria bacterium]|nr:hypothetical protein [Acidobacteriota bacterium]